MSIDKVLERERYNRRAQSILEKGGDLSNIAVNSLFPSALQAPYYFFKSLIENKELSIDSTILEIGAGTGAFTETLLKTGAQVTATDISEHSLHILKKKNQKYINLTINSADMELLPFDKESFDLVVSAGSLSYGDNNKVMNEIYRVLKKNGVFICVDSLNHNPIYKLNRWLHYFRGHRTGSTLKRMPTVSLIEMYGKKFGSVQASFFGTISWLVPLLKKLFSDDKVARISDNLDNFVNVKKSAFKFVMVVKKEK